MCLLWQAHLSSCPDKEKGAQERLVEPLMSLVKSYEGGRESHARVIVQSLFDEYLSVEELFSDNIQVNLSVWNTNCSSMLKMIMPYVLLHINSASTNIIWLAINIPGLD